MHHVLIQHALDTDRYHPAYYRLAPFPGGVDGGPVRYKSRGHHTTGFDTLAEAQASAVILAAELGLSADRFDVREMTSAGADVILMDPA